MSAQPRAHESCVPFSPGLRSPIITRSHEPHLSCPHRAADELDPETNLHLIDEGAHLDEGRPSSVAKNTLAEPTMSFASSNSTICFLNRVISSCSSDDAPGARPASISARFFHNRDVSGLSPRRLATWLAAV